MERFMPREVLRQTDNQTCLPTSLLMLYSWLYPEKELDFRGLERKLYGSSFGIHRDYYVLSHVTTFARKFSDVDLTLMIDSPTFATHVAEKNTEKRIKVKQQSITVSWIREATKEAPLLIYVDAFHINCPIHIPHFLYVLQDEEKKFYAIDPGYGKVTGIPDETLDHAIGGLKYHLLWSPVAIGLNKSK